LKCLALHASSVLPHGDSSAGDASASAALVTLASLMNQKMGRVCKPYSHAGVCQRTASFAASCERIQSLVAGAGRTPGDLTGEHRSDILQLTIFNGSKIIVQLDREALMNLGKRIQDLRRRRGLTTGELAARVQVTSGFISQLEHSKTDPSLQTLQRVAAALQVPLSCLLLDDEIKPQVVRKDERHVIHAGNGGPRASILSPLPSRQLELVLLELPPGGVPWTKGQFHDGHECHLVVQGKVRASYGGERYLLDEGDSIFWDGAAPHGLENVGDEVAQIVMALTPPALLPLEQLGSGKRTETGT
jgi:transcriptional regulator with XRE-family HTH domain